MLYSLGTQDHDSVINAKPLKRLPEEDRLPLSDGDIVHLFVVGLGFSLTADGQTCGKKEEQSETHGNTSPPASAQQHLHLKEFSDGPDTTQ